MDDGQNVRDNGMEVSSNLKTLPFIFKERIDEMVPEYPSNSNKSKEEAKPQLQPVVEKPAGVRKKRQSKLLKIFFEQDFNDIKQGLYTEYVEPKMKDLTWSFIQAGIDTVMNAMRMMVYKDYHPVDRSKIPAERYSYSNYYSSSTPRPAPTMASEVNYDEFIYATRGEAEAVLQELKNQIARCRCATVLDLYNVSNVSTSNYTLQDWGWTDLSFAEIRQNSEGYLIALPKAKLLPR